MKLIFWLIVTACQISTLLAADFECPFRASEIIDYIAKYTTTWSENTAETTSVVASLTKQLSTFKSSCSSAQQTGDIQAAEQGSQRVTVQSTQINTGCSVFLEQCITLAQVAERVAHSSKCQSACDSLGKLIASTKAVADKINDCQQKNHKATTKLVDATASSLGSVQKENIGDEIFLQNSVMSSSAASLSIEYEMCKSIYTRALACTLKKVKAMIDSCNVSEAPLLGHH